MDEKTLDELRELAKQENRDISSLLTEAVQDLLNKKKIKPIFYKASDEAFDEFDEALEELAK
ncbi:MAG: hypothetical protein CME69_07725 [Halobacteriovorax sp.]|nr:hypothetical protein [Halobacteriovorax sp.]